MSRMSRKYVLVGNLRDSLVSIHVDRIQAVLFKVFKLLFVHQFFVGEDKIDLRMQRRWRTTRSAILGRRQATHSEGST